jgi:hypothetical protein
MNTQCTVSVVEDKPIVKIQNTILNWCFLHRPSEMSDKFEVTFCPSGAEAELESILLEFFFKNISNKKLSPSWLGGKGLLEKDNENSPVRFKAKLSHSYQEKEGETKERIVAVFNKKNERLIPVPQIANGAIANLALYMSLQVDKTGKKFGVSLYIKSIQLIDWVEYSGVSCDFAPLEEPQIVPERLTLGNPNPEKEIEEIV